MKTIKEESANSSAKLLSCRACLATEVQLYNIHENRLAEAFSHLTGTPVLVLDGLPQHLCAYCCATLHKCASFRAKCLRVQCCLATRVPHELTTSYIKTIDRLSHRLLLNLTSKKLDTTDYTDSVQVEEIKKEDIDNIFTESDDLKIEYEIKDKDDIEDFSNDDNTDEHIFVTTNPVADVKKKKGRRKKIVTEKRAKRKIKKRISDNDYLPDFDFAKFESSYSVEIIALTKEQQLEEIQARKSSDNYQYAAFKCEECGKGFRAEDAYNNHMIRHSPSMGGHACEVCRVRFKRASRRQEHQDLHRLKFLCRECSFVSRNRYQAKKHFEWHTGKIHVCKHCGASFTKSSTYLSHVRLQHPAMNVACDVCGEPFVGRLGLLQHKSRAHPQIGSVKPESKCPSCGVQFSSRDALSRHVASAGCDSDLRPCLICGESLRTEELLQSHVQECHNADQFKCLECNKTFASSSSYDVHHQRVHLNVRWRKSRDKRAADARQTRRDEPPKRREAMCEICGKACESNAALVYHQRSHTGERPYKCAQCPKSFTMPQALIVSAWDGLPRHLCACCRTLLLKSSSFRERGQHAQLILEEMLATEHSITTDIIRTIDRISQQLTLHLTTNIIDQTPIEYTFDDESKEDIYFPENTEIDTKYDDIYDNYDAEDIVIKEDLVEPVLEEIEKEEIPKKVLRKRRKVSKVKVQKKVVKETKDVKVRQKVDFKRKKKGFKRFFSCEEDYVKFENNYNISIVKVTEEEQRKDMELRKESANYARAHLRCEKCYKGFLSEATFENHQKVHDPSMGSNECQLCFARFKHPTRLRRHMETHTLKFICKLCPLVTRHRGMAMMHSDFHSGKTFECKYCGLTFKKKTTFNTHIRVQHPLENAAGGTCDVCGETFIGRRGLQQHKTMAHRKLPIPELKCAACGVQFENLDAVVRHAAPPDNVCDPSLRSCPQCGESFLTSDQLECHMESAHVKQVYKCDDCDKSFATKSSLGTHVDRVHLKIKPKKTGFYKYHMYPKKMQTKRVEEICEICGKGYPSSTWLKYHQRTHTGERPYKCPECPKSYMTPAALQSHSVSHTGVRRWQCSQCPKTFLHQSSIYKHKLVHTGEKPFECHICNKTFTQSGSLATHVKYVHMKVKPPPRRRRRDAPV